MTEFRTMEMSNAPIEHYAALSTQLTSTDWRNALSAQTELNRKSDQLIPLSLDNAVDPSAPKDARARAWNHLYGGSPERSVKMDNVLQPYDLGNCYLMSSIAAVAKYNPKTIEQAISVNADGTYNVRFSGDKVPMRITAPTDVPPGQENALWQYVIEKAYGEHRKCEQNDVCTAQDLGDKRNAELITSGAEKNHNEILHMLTGLKPREILSDKSSAEDMHKVLCDIKDRNLPATTGTGGRIDGISNLPANMEGHHAYAIADYDKARRVVTLYNPHGSRVALTLDQFRRYCVGIATVQ